MLLEKLEVGPLGVNCYLAGDEAGREAIIIDPGADAEAIISSVEKLKLDVKLLVVTHGHFDHTGALKALKDATNAGIAIHKDDAPMLNKKDPIAASFGFSFPVPPPADKLLSDGEKITIGKLIFQVIHTPGHTPGCICLLVGNKLFSGDTLFYSGVGRTDLPGGSTRIIQESIRGRLFTLPDDTVVYPGHGPETTIGQEKQGNPYV